MHRASYNDVERQKYECKREQRVWPPRTGRTEARLAPSRLRLHIMDQSLQKPSCAEPPIHTLRVQEHRCLPAMRFLTFDGSFRVNLNLERNRTARGRCHEYVGHAHARNLHRVLMLWS